ncbi:enoyl-CoA hydratase/isomerase family protein [Horticoccus luteus]|uniref:Enoyl-CoA hydratase/isomerase family protein n=1 Tax=Horticoccus luteus TaxID=2862869 RepID=A0A8F9TW52_9BACT|nr:enoyl-CoA hydratase-related protein [Horticoccus luteus]QYM79182.1 enoyl-CoA hydratase/isomerase family protein [Horticoccus luteus]
MTSVAPLLCAATGAVTTLTLNRPDKRNALNVELLTALLAGLETAGADATQRILILRGAGPVFCAGLDLAEAARPERAHASADLVARALAALSGTRLATIAVVQGAAIAGGAGLMAACDFAVATRNAKFGFPEVRRGLVAGLILTFLRRQLRERDLRELLLLGAPFDAAHAHALGLVNRLADDSAALEHEVDSLVHALLHAAPGAIAQTKQLLRDLWPHTVQHDLDHALAFHLQARNSPEAQEGIAAFQAKRLPSWAPPA